MAKIQITENELKQIIRESVECELKEIFGINTAGRQKQLTPARAKGNSNPPVATSNSNVSNNKLQTPQKSGVMKKVRGYLKTARDANSNLVGNATSRQQIGLNNIASKF